MRIFRELWRGGWGVNSPIFFFFNQIFLPKEILVSRTSEQSTILPLDFFYLDTIVYLGVPSYLINWY